MTNLISAECFYSLEDAKENLQATYLTLDKYFQLSTDIPHEVLGEYHASYMNMMKIIQEVREQCEAVGEFLGHDFKNYITPLQSCHDVIRKAFHLQSTPVSFERERIPDSKTSRTPLERLKTRMYLNRGIVNAIGSLRFYVDGTLEGENILIVDFFNYQKEVFNRAFRRPIVYSFIEDVTAYFHPDTLGNLLQNIFDNARKRGKATEVEVTCQRAGDKIEIIIKDNGCGMDPLEDEANVEDIFIRGKSRTGGTGLGLADAKERMAAMKGEITCEGHGGLENPETKVRGACFRILLSQKL